MLRAELVFFNRNVARSCVMEREYKLRFVILSVM